MVIVCEQCDSRVFKHKQYLLQHLDTSSAYHPHCEPCNRRFSSKSALDAHLKTSSKHPHYLPQPQPSPSSSTSLPSEGTSADSFWEVSESTFSQSPSGTSLYSVDGNYPSFPVAPSHSLQPTQSSVTNSKGKQKEEAEGYPCYSLSPSTQLSVTNSKGKQKAEPKGYSFLYCRLCKRSPADAIMATECGHLFCEACIFQFILWNAYCPVCKVPLLLHQVHRLHLA
ncbi:hypothetical protein CPC08DRAFT_71938 [Agrocybe pediades]|nr:hypothetical protein CPC08DRAFT_71938 [Agrocybe pediades]